MRSTTAIHTALNRAAVLIRPKQQPGDHRRRHHRPRQRLLTVTSSPHGRRATSSQPRQRALVDDAASSADRPQQRLLSSSDSSPWLPYRGGIANAADPHHDTSVGRPLGDPNRWLLYDRRARPRAIDNVP